MNIEPIQIWAGITMLCLIIVVIALIIGTLKLNEIRKPKMYTINIVIVDDGEPDGDKHVEVLIKSKAMSADDATAAYVALRKNFPFLGIEIEPE